MKKLVLGLLFALLAMGRPAAASIMAVEAPVPLDEPLYAQITADTCVMRAQAKRTAASIQRIDARGAPVLLEGVRTDARGCVWYFLAYEGREGYLPEESLLLLTDAEYAALHNDATPSPEAAALPAPAPTRSAAYIGNADSMVFHQADCGSLPSPVRQLLFSYRETAIARGFIPCLLCKP